RTVDVTLREHLAEMAGELCAMLVRARGEAAFLAEFQLYALGDPDVRASLAAIYAETFAGHARVLAGPPDLGRGGSPQRLGVAGLHGAVVPVARRRDRGRDPAGVRRAGGRTGDGRPLANDLRGRCGGAAGRGSRAMTTEAPDLIVAPAPATAAAKSRSRPARI